jgi:hypothetical protein
VRFGTWKAVRKPIFAGAIGLYDVASDAGEQQNRLTTHASLSRSSGTSNGPMRRTRAGRISDTRPSSNGRNRNEVKLCCTI